MPIVGVPLWITVHFPSNEIVPLRNSRAFLERLFPLNYPLFNTFFSITVRNEVAIVPIM